MVVDDEFELRQHVTVFDPLVRQHLSQQDALSGVDMKHTAHEVFGRLRNGVPVAPLDHYVALTDSRQDLLWRVLVRCRKGSGAVVGGGGCFLWWIVVVVGCCGGGCFLWWIVVVVGCCGGGLLWWWVVVVVDCCGGGLLWWFFMVVVLLVCCIVLCCISFYCIAFQIAFIEPISN